MKLTTLMLIIALVQASAAGFSQVRLSAKNASLETVFGTIKKQTGYTFFYDLKDVRDVKVTVQINGATLNEALDKCLSDLPLTYEIKDKTVFVSKKEPTFFEKVKAVFIAPMDLTGRVLDERGQPIPGATVSVKNSNQITITDEKGIFTLQRVDNDAVIIVSVVGYDKKEITARNNNLGDIQLTQATSKLDEVQIQAYGTTSQRLSTSNISSVKAVDIEKQPVNNPLLALEGRIPGLSITQSTGVAGGGIIVRVQGRNSLSRGSDPLYVIDGVAYNSQLLPNLDNNVLGSNGGVVAPSGNGNPLNFLNPSDIESIDVLKDADATAIYGSRAAAGAILITTKKGKSGQTQVSGNVQSGAGSITRMVKLLNSSQYLEMRHEAKRNDGAAILATDYDLNGTWDTTRNTDWQKKLIGGTALYTDANVSLSGGNTNTQFLLGTGYHRETSVFPGDFADKKGSLRFNLNNTSTNQKFKIQFNSSYVIDNNNLPGTDLTNIAIKLAPVAPTLYNSDGTLNWAPLANGNSSWYNPLAYTKATFNRDVTSLIMSAILSYEITKSLQLKSNFGYTNLHTDEYYLQPLDIYAPESRASNTRRSSFGNSYINSYSIEPQLSYKVKLSNGILSVLTGATFLTNSYASQQFNATGFNNDLVMKDIKSASSVTVGSTISTNYKYNALFGRINYNYSDRYIINLTARRDGSSRFGPENLFHNFGSVGTAWLFSNESFIKNNLPFLSFGKLRASYGTTGNDQIGDYQFLSLYSSVLGVATAYQGAVGILPTGLSNPYLQWEETRKLQIGTDLGFWNDRIIFNFSYYHNRSYNQLQNYALPYTTGFNAVQVNLPAIIQNTGWELSSDARIIAKENFKWSVNANLTIPANKLIAYDGLANSSLANVLVVGQPLSNTTKTYKYNGVDPATGLFTFIDKNGNITSTPTAPGDQYVLNNTAPKYFGGLQNSFSYKRISLDVLFQFVKQKGAGYSLGSRPGSFTSTNTGGLRANQPVTVLDRWQKSGDNSFFQKFSSTYPIAISTPFDAANTSDLVFSDASYIRLKNISLSWQFPKNWERFAHLQGARIFLQGQNVLTITKYVGLDPENQSLTNLPPLKVWTLGLQVTL